LERWNADIFFGSDTIGESSIAITANLYQQQNQGKDLGEQREKSAYMTRKLHAQEYSDYGSTLTEVSHGHVCDIFDKLAAMIRPLLGAAATEDQTMAEAHLSETLFVLLVGKDVCNWAIPGLAAIREIFVNSIEAQHEE